MFTGIIKEVALVTTIRKKPSLTVLGISAPKIAAGARVSDSITVNGVCLTLTRKQGNELIFEVVEPTLASTNLKRLRNREFVNLEPALEVGEKVGGHFVLGHIDSELKLKRLMPRGDYWQMEIDLPARFRHKIIENGSIAIEGISLTIKKVLPRTFTVDIIPFTYKNTILQYKRPGAWLNVEFDYLLKGKR